MIYQAAQWFWAFFLQAKKFYVQNESRHNNVVTWPWMQKSCSEQTSLFLAVAKFLKYCSFENVTKNA